jgi:hypothetical protein
MGDNTNKNNKAIKLAMLADGDKSDMQECVSDLVQNSKLDEGTAREIASAIRYKYLPKVAEDLGISTEEAHEVLANNDFFDRTFDQTNNNNNRKINEPGDSSPIGSNNVNVDDNGAKDEPIAKMSAASNSNNIRLATDEALSDPAFAKFVKIEDDFDEFDINEANEYSTVNERSAQSNKNGNKKDSENKLGGKDMTQREINARKAQRAKLVREAEELLNASTKPFEYSGKAQMNEDREYPTMHMEDDGGNSLKGDTTKFNETVEKTSVPTMNPAEDLLLRDDYDLFRFDSSPDGGLEYTLPKDMFGFDVPSSGEDRGEEFKVPTQMGKAPRKTTVAMGFDVEMDEDMDEGMGMKPKGFAPDHEDMGGPREEVEEFSFDLDDDEDDELSVDTEDEDMGDDLDADMDDDIDMGDENTDEDVDITPSEVLDAISSFDEDTFGEFLSGFQAWAAENEVELGGDAVELSRESVASVLGPEFNLDKAEEVLYSDLVKAGVSADDISKLTYAQGIDLYHSIKTATVDVKTDEAEFKFSNIDDDYEDSDDDDDEVCAGGNCEDAVEATSKDVEEMKKAAEVREARLKVASSIWYKMAHYGVVDIDEVEEYIENWMDEGLTVKAMIQQGQVMLKTAAASNRTKTASTNGTVQFTNALATTPAFIGGTPSDKAQVLDLKQALSGLFTQPQIDK